MKSFFRAGIIGCGRVASLLEKDPLRWHPCTHAGGFRAVKEVKIVAACDIAEDRLSLFGKEWEVGKRHLYVDYRLMLEREHLDIVSICSWTDTHAQMTCDAAEAGVKGVICEKPMALDLSEARRMLRTCKRHGTHLMINHERRWDSLYRKAKELIDKGVIGEVRTMVGNVLTGSPRPGDWHSDYRKVGGGPLLHDGTHLMDLLNYFGGEPEWVVAHVERKNKELLVEDTGVGFVHFKNGIHAVVEGGGVRNYFNFELDIQGDRGRILVGNEDFGLWVTDISPRYTGFWELKKVEFPARDPINPCIAIVEDMIKCITGVGENISSGEDGLKALELVMAFYESERIGGGKVWFPLKFRKSPLGKILERK